jgi:hypothetical protein
MDDFLLTLPVIFVSLIVAMQVLRAYEPSERTLLWLSFSMHHVLSVCHILIMDLYYGYGDIFAYARQGRYIAAYLSADFMSIAPGLLDVLLQKPEPAALPFEILGGSTGSMQALVAFAMFFFQGSIYAACAAVAGIAFLSKLALYGVAKRELPYVPQRTLIVCCMLVPSTVFWSTVLLKEAIAVIGLCVAVRAWSRFINGERGLRVWLGLALGSATIILTKGYIFPVLGIGMAVWYLLHFMNARNDHVVFKLWHMVAAVGLVAVAIAGAGLLMPEFAIENLEEQLAQQQVVGERERGGSTYSLAADAGQSSQLALAPLGLLTSLFRPLLFESSSVLILLSALEMSFFVVFSFLALYRGGFRGTFTEVLRRPFLGFCAAFVLLFGTGVGLATTNLGTLVRYRMPLIPFFAILLLTLVQRSKQSAAVSAPAPAANAGWPAPRLPSLPGSGPV